MNNIVAKKKLIINCGMTSNETLALFYLLNNENLDILGVNINVSDIYDYKEVKNMVYLFKKFKFKNYPKLYLTKKYLDSDSKCEFGVYSEKHSKKCLDKIFYGNKLIPMEFDHLVNYDFNEFLKNILDENDNEIYFLELDDFSTLNQFIKENRELAKDFKRIVTIGGKLNPYAKVPYYVKSGIYGWNELSAKNVFNFFSKYDLEKIFLVPYEEVNKVVWTPNVSEIVKRLIISENDKKLFKFISDILEKSNDIHWKFDKTIGTVIGDSLTATVIELEDKYGFSKWTAIDVNTSCFNEKHSKVFISEALAPQTKFLGNFNIKEFWLEYLSKTFNSIDEKELQNQLDLQKWY